MEKAKPIEITDYALQQLENEFNYFTQEYTVEYAEKFRMEFFREIDKIQPMYKKYPECRFLRTKERIYRNVVWKNYLIVYKITKESIVVLTVFHTKLNPKRLNKLKK